MLDKILTWAANLWLFLVIVITIFDFTGIFDRAPTAWAGLMGSLAELLNYRFYTTIALTSSPAFLLLWWRQRRRDRIMAEK